MRSTSRSPSSGRLGARGLRTKGAWVLAVPFLVLAKPTPTLLALGALPIGLGLLVRGWSAGTIRKEEVLATSGPYAHTRHPLYLGSLLIGLGLALTGGHWGWPVLFLAYFVFVYRRTAAGEAERLTELFGHRYVEYASSVPAFLPRLTPYRSERADPARFSWRRYRRNREWEALLGAAAALAVLVLKTV